MPTPLKDLSPAEEAVRLKEGLSRPQYQVFTDPARFRVLVAGRRMGKSFLLIREAIRAAQTGERKNVAILSPQLKQCKRNFWSELKDALPIKSIANKNETSLTIELKGYGSKISLFGADNADSMRGQGFDFVGIDEVADIAHGVWTAVVRPALSDRKGEALMCGTPKQGSWVQDLETFCRDPINAGKWSYHHYTSIQGGNIDEEEIEEARRTLDPIIFAQEYMADWVNSQSRVLKLFDRDTHIQSWAEDEPGLPLIMGSDQGINPYCAVLANIRQIEGRPWLVVFDEFCEIGATTQDCIEWLKHRYMKSDSGLWKRELIMSPDPNAKNRHSSASDTDISQFLSAGIKVKAPKKIKHHRDKVNTMNPLLMKADGTVSFACHPRAKRLIKSMEMLSWQPGTDHIDKDNGWDHMTDALFHLAMVHFPVRKSQIFTHKLKGF